MNVTFGPWRPDVATLNSPFTVNVVNVLRAANHYIPFPTLTPFTGALSDAPLGAITVRDSTEAIHIFAGTAETLEKLDTTDLDWDDVSQAATTYAASVDTRWWFVQWGDYVVAGNINDDPQSFQLGVSTEFADLAGNPPNASAAAVCGTHLFLFAGTTAYWSDTDDIGEWSSGNAGSQTFPDGGPIYGATDTTNPIIFQKSAIRIGSFLPGSDPVFAFTKIHDKRGVAYPYSFCKRGEFAFFADSGAFLQCLPDGQLIPIGKEKVDRTVFAMLQGGSGDIYGEIDPFHSRVYWAIKVNSTSSAFDKIVVYDWDIKEWTQIDTPLDILLPLSSGTVGYTLEGLDALYASLEDIPFSLDSKVWQGGSPVMAAFDTLYRLCFFAGPNAEATLTTSELGEISGLVTFLDGAQCDVDSNAAVLSVGSRMRRGDVQAWTTEYAMNDATGGFDFLSEARFHQFRVRLPVDSGWSQVAAENVPAKPAGWR